MRLNSDLEHRQDHFGAVAAGHAILAFGRLESAIYRSHGRARAVVVNAVLNCEPWSVRTTCRTSLGGIAVLAVDVLRDVESDHVIAFREQSTRSSLARPQKIRSYGERIL